MNNFKHAKKENMQNGHEVSVGGNGIDSDICLSMGKVDGKNVFFLSTYTCVDYKRGHLVVSTTHKTIKAAKEFLYPNS